MHLTHEPKIGIAATKDLFEIAELQDSYLANQEQRFLRLVLFPASFFCGLVVVAKDSKNQIIGYSYALRALEPDHWYLGYVYVEETSRNSQVAKKMQIRLEEEVQKRGGKKFFATVSPNNLFSLMLLLNGLGWHGYDFKRNYYGKGEHRIFVSKNLFDDSPPQNEVFESATFIQNNDYSQLTSLLKANNRIIGAFMKEESAYLALIKR
ncbi:MAG: GNAT family N-acetyltransferase [Candidatus Bathyarchaeota archaeon]|nr:GNAT family N-acetyltransferase [Candidatus Bathyarchaeota archaeon]